MPYRRSVAKSQESVQFRKVAALKAELFSTIVVEPMAQDSAGCAFLEPRVQMHRGMRNTTGPQSVNQDSIVVRFCRLVVNAFNPNYAKQPCNDVPLEALHAYIAVNQRLNSQYDSMNFRR